MTPAGGWPASTLLRTSARLGRGLAVLTTTVLGAGCVDGFLPPEPGDDPVTVFDALWREADRHYAFFESKQIDWDAVRDVGWTFSVSRWQEFTADRRFLEARQARVGLAGSRCRLPRRERLGDLPATPAVVDQVEADVAHDPEDPGAERAPATERLAVAHHPEEGLLDRVGRGVGIAEDPTGEGEELVVVSIEQPPHGIAVAFPEGVDQRFVARLGHGSRGQG